MRAPNLAGIRENDLGVINWQFVSQMRATTERNRILDVLRIAFALMVILSHAPQMTDGNASREILVRLTKGNLDFGTVGVDGFFLLSGFLIVKSWHTNPHPLHYLSNRILRIVPGYVVAVILSTVVVGLLAPAGKDFFQHLGWRFLRSILILGSPETPPVFPGMAYPLVNGSLWTISFEFFCYLVVLAFGMLGAFRFRGIWLIVTACLMGLQLSPIHSSHFARAQLGRLTAAFFVGGCFYLYRERIRFNHLIAFAAAAGLITVLFLMPHELSGSLIILGGYLVFYLAQIHVSLPAFPDVSYGLYLYGSPVESLWIWYRHGSPWITFFVSSLICLALGWASWHFIEGPMLLLKQRSSAPGPVEPSVVAPS